MAQSKVNHKENVPLSSGKKGKKTGPAQRNTNGNPFDAIADDDGNAKNAKEFDLIPHSEDEMFFMVDEDLTGDERKVCHDPLAPTSTLQRGSFLGHVWASVYHVTFLQHRKLL